jgi:hypothetical protein
LKGHGFTTCKKVQMVEQEVSGHDFSRAEISRIMSGLLQAAEKLFD